MSDRYELFLTCPKGLEGLLLEEATGLGLEEAREHTSAIRGMATMETAYRLCLWSRLANRVLLVLKRFPMKDAEDLYHGVLDVDWQDHMVPDGTLAVEFSGHGSGIDNTHFGALKVKDAIVDKLRTPSGERPSIDKISPDMQPAPARLPPAAGCCSAEGKPRGGHPDPCGLATYGRRRCCSG